MPGNHNSGRRPEPRALKLLRGNPGRRRLAPEPPAATPADPLLVTPPTELAGNARASDEWRRIAPELTESDRAAAIALCLEWAAYLTAQAQLRESRTAKDSEGVPKISPWVVVADRALSQCLRLWNELGLTPSGRGRRARHPTNSRQPPAPPASKWGSI